MNASSLTGLVLIVGLGVCLAAFIPGWLRGGQADTNFLKNRTVTIAAGAAKFKVRARSFRSLTTRVHRLTALRRVLGVTTLLGAATALISLVNIGALWQLGVVSLGVAIAAVIANRFAAAAIVRSAHLKPAVRKTAPGMYSALYSAAQQFGEKTSSKTVEPKEQGWVPREMPAPLHAGHVGTLEQPVLAEVTPIVPTQIEATEPPLSGDKLDEILRRRRAV